MLAWWSMVAKTHHFHVAMKTTVINQSQTGPTPRLVSLCSVKMVGTGFKAECNRNISMIVMVIFAGLKLNPPRYPTLNIFWIGAYHDWAKKWVKQSWQAIKPEPTIHYHMSREVRKTGLWGFRPGPTQIRLCSLRKWLEAWNFCI